MWCHGTVAELLGEAGLCRCAQMPDAAYVQVTERFWRIAPLTEGAPCFPILSPLARARR